MIDSPEYKRMIPVKFEKNSGINNHTFHIRNPFWHPFKYALTVDEKIVKIPPSAGFYIEKGSQMQPLAITTALYPEISEAILLTGSALFAGGRVERFLNIAKAYECLEKTPKIELLATRHGLAHSALFLNRPKTVFELTKNFGSTLIDLKKSAHVRVFYQKFVELLIENDKLLSSKIGTIKNAYKKSKPYKRLLHNWWVERDHTHFYEQGVSRYLPLPEDL